VAGVAWRLRVNVTFASRSARPPPPPPPPPPAVAGSIT